MRFGFIAQQRTRWPLGWLCQALQVTRGGFYAWRGRPQSHRTRSDIQFTAAIRVSFHDSDRTYGARRVRRDLRDAGQPCGLHRVRRLMRHAALVARPTRRGRPVDRRLGAPHWIAQNVLDRQFSAAEMNCKWVADFTYVWTTEGWLYVAAVMDLFSRRIVGWSMSAEMTSQLVSDAMVMAIWRRAPTGALLHHSDRGSQYTSEPFQQLLQDHGVSCSMSRSGNCWDNAAMESFFSTLKTERTHRHHYGTRDEAKADVFDYIERFYNPRRRHSTLDYLSPNDFEKSQGSG